MAMAGLQEGWVSLHTPPEELLLANTLVTGQSFRWRRTDDSSYEMYTGVIGQRLVQMRQLPTDVQYRVLARSPTEDAAADASVLQDYFNLSTSLAQLAQHWARQDPRYALVAPALPGCRMLRQDPVECLFQFICSSNNHISRIHGMVERLCSTYGTPLQPASSSREGSSQLEGQQQQQQQQQQTAGNSRGMKLEPETPAAAGPGGPSQPAQQQRQQQQELSSIPLPFCEEVPQQHHSQQQQPQPQQLLLQSGQGLPSFYAFPTLEQLSAATEEGLRADGFGYRAKYIVGSVQQLLEKPEGGSAWLLALRDKPYAEAHEALCSLPGVGPKVAACICLFSLDKHDAIPVDTHVWDLATKYYAPHLAKKSLTPKLHAEVQLAFVDRFGPYAGWAHNCMFISELASHKHLLPTGPAAAAAAAAVSKNKRKSVELPSTPGSASAAAAAAAVIAPPGVLEAACLAGMTGSPDMTGSSPSMQAAAEAEAGVALQLAVVRRRRRRPAKYAQEAGYAADVQVPL